MGLVIAAAVFAVLGWAVLQSVRVLPHETAVPDVTVRQIGVALMGRYVLPLEIVAVLLTAALIGAVIVAMHEKEGEEMTPLAGYLTGGRVVVFDWTGRRADAAQRDSGADRH